MATDRGYPTKKLKPDAQKAKLDKLGTSKHKTIYPNVRVSPKRGTHKKKY